MPFRLGLLPLDHARIATLPKRLMGAVIPPTSLDRHDLPFTPGLYDNDTLPDCTAAGLANSLAAATAIRGYAPAISAPLVPAFYAACIGMPGADAHALAATAGAEMTSVLDYAMTNGVQLDSQAPYVPTHSVVDHTDRFHVAQVIAAGSLYFGVELRQSDMDRFETGQPWDDDGTDQSTPLGGHCIVGWSYDKLGDTATMNVATWGKQQAATWRWFAARCIVAFDLDWHLPAA